MPKIVFNEFPKTRQPFPFEKYDFKLDLSEIKLSSQAYKNGFSHVASLGIDLNGVHVPIAEIELYHSGSLHNFEETFESSQILLKEIVNRFNSFIPKGQQCLEFS